MANETSNTTNEVKVLGKIEGIQGKVIVVDSNGVSSPGKVGQPLSYGSTIKTMGSSVVLLNVEGHGVVSLGHDEELTLDQQLLALLDQILQDGIGEGVNFELIAGAIESGESIEDLIEAPAAGGSEGSSSSSAGNAARVEFTADRITPESGFETTGLTRVVTQLSNNDFQQFNSAPVTTGIANTVIDEDLQVSFDLSQSFSDPDIAQTLQFSVDSLPEGLSFNADTGVLSGAPTNASAFTQNGQYVISVTATDNSGFVNNSVTTQFTLSVNNVNDAPIAGAPIDLGQINEDQSVIISSAQLLQGSSDIDATDVLTVASVSLLSGQGEITNNGDGTFTYTPSDDWFGNPEFSYTITDSQGGQVENTGSLAVASVNDAPIANVDALVSTVPLTSVNIDAMANDTDVDGDTLSITSATATNGAVVIESDGTLTYTPNDGFFGSDTIQYTLSDGNGGESQSTVPVSVVYDPGVVAINDSITLDDSTPTFTGTSANIEGDITLTVNGVDYTVTPAGDGTWSFTVPSGAELPDGNYQITASGSDILNNESTTSDDFVIDAFIPTVTIVDQNSISNSFPTFEGTSAHTDGDFTLTVGGVDYTVTPQANGDWSFTVPTALADGDYAAQINVSDAQGNTASAEDVFVIDAFLPEVTIEDQSIVSGTVVFSGSSANTDGDLMLNVNGMSYSVTPAADGSWTFTLPPSDVLPDGNYSATILGNDAQGNSASDRDDFVVDNDFPIVTIDNLDTINSPLPTFSGTSANIVGDVTLTVNGIDYTITPDATTGAWLFTIPDADALADGDYTASVTGSDSAGNVSNDSDGFVINAVDDIPVISGDTAGSVVEDSAPELTVTGDLDASGGDPGEDQFNAETQTGVYGELVIGTDGGWAYSADNSQAAIQALAPGQTLTDTFTVLNADGVTSQAITITINGNDDVPTITGDTSGSVTEDDAATLTTSGDLDAAGGDTGEDAFTPAILNGTHGDLTINAAGEWSYSAENSQAAIQALTPGQTLTETFTVLNADGVTSQDITITINGNDDVPTITGDTSGSVTEDDAATLTTSGDLDAAGGDAGEDAFTPATLNGTHGDLTINAAGEWSYSTDNSQAAIQALAPGQSLTETFTVLNADGVTSQAITITINGNDDVPTITGDTSGSVTEDDAATLTTSGDLNAAGGDAGEDAFTPATLNGTHGDLTINAAGEWSYSAENSQAAIQALAPGQSLTETFTVLNADGVTSQAITITINGNDDVPTITGDTSGSVTEDDAATLTVSGDLDATGGDAGEDEFTPATLTGTYGDLTINAAGEWRYSANNSQTVIQQLAVGVALTDTFTVTNADGVTTESIEITINGTDDVPTITGDIAGTITEDDAPSLTVTGDLDASGGDAGEDLFEAETIVGTYGELTIDINGNWSYSASNDQEAIQRLTNSSDTLTDTITVTNADGVTTQDIVITIRGDLNGVPDVFVDDSDITSTTASIDVEFVGDDFDPTPQDDFTDAGGVDPANLTLTTESNLTVNFVSESAGFSSSVGWYQIDDSGQIINTQIIWADSNNISAADSTFTFNNVDEGRIGFFLVQNGFTEVSALLARGSGFFRFEDSAGSPATASTSGAVLVYYSDGDENNPAGFRLELPPTIHASNRNLNPDGLEHSDSGVDAGDPSRLIIGFEDLLASNPSNPNAGVDWDLRDFLFSIEISSVVQNVASVASGLEIVDDGTELQSALALITLGRNADQLTLLDATEDLANTYGISVDYDAAARTLNFSGNASITQYQEILSQIQVANTDLLGTDPRQIEIQVTDTDGNTSVVTSINLNGDTSYSFDQDDFIAGDDGNNVLSGLVGDDVILGGLGNDTVTGGAGSDTFVWKSGDEASSAIDNVTDFTAGVGGDVLDFSDLLQGETNTALSLDDYLDFSSDGTDTTISIDINGDGSGSDMSVVLQGVDLTALGVDQTIIQSLLDNNNIITD